MVEKRVDTGKASYPKYKLIFHYPTSDFFIDRLRIFMKNVNIKKYTKIRTKQAKHVLLRFKNKIFFHAT